MHNFGGVGSRTHGRGTFSLQQEKVPKKCRPKQPAQKTGKPQISTLPTRRLDHPSGLTNLNSPSMANCRYQS